MLYIDDIGNNTIRFGNAQGGGSYPKFLSKPLYAESDLLGRVWIKDGHTEINYLNCYDPSQITLEGTVYEVDDFVSEFNIIGSLLNYILTWGFWSKEDDNDYYASLEDDSPYYSITEKN